MALVKLEFPKSVPLADNDYTRKNDLIDVLKNSLDTDLILSSGSIASGFHFVIGGSVYQADSDTAVSGTQTSYIKITASGSTATAEYVSDMSDASWNEAYNGYYDDDGNLYIVDEDVAFVDGEITTGHDRFVEKNGSGEYTGNLAGIIVGTSGDIVVSSIAALLSTSPVYDSFSSPSTFPSGLTVNVYTNELISCDRDSDLIYLHTGISSSTPEAFPSPGPDPSGLAFDATTGNLISCDLNTDMIYIHSGVQATILDSFSSPGAIPRGLTIDTSTGNLISCDAGTDMIYIHDGISSTIIDSFSAFLGQPAGLTFDSFNNNLLSVYSNKISTHNGATDSLVLDSSTPSNFGDGLAYVPSTGRVVFCDSLSATIYVFKRVLYSL